MRSMGIALRTKAAGKFCSTPWVSATFIMQFGFDLLFGHCALRKPCIVADVFHDPRILYPTLV